MTSFAKRKEVIISETEAVKEVEDGMTIAIGGMVSAGHPMAIIRQIIKKGVKNLIVVGAAASGLEVDLLIGVGAAKKVITSYLASETEAPIGPFFRAYAQEGKIDVWETDESTYYVALRAAAQMLPFLPSRAGVGTSFTEVNPDIKEFKDPIKGETLLAIPPIKPDIAFLHAAYADPFGNVQHIGTGFGDRAIYMAAEKTIVEVEKIVPNEDIRKNPALTSIPEADAIVRAPYGSHPFASPGFYLEDRKHLREYVSAANFYLKDRDMSKFDAYLQKYIYEVDTHLDYLEKIGIKQLFSLCEY